MPFKIHHADSSINRPNTVSMPLNSKKNRFTFVALIISFAPLPVYAQLTADQIRTAHRKMADEMLAAGGYSFFSEEDVLFGRHQSVIHVDHVDDQFLVESTTIPGNEYTVNTVNSISKEYCFSLSESRVVIGVSFATW